MEMRERKEVRLGRWLVELSLIADADDDDEAVDQGEKAPRVAVRVVGLAEPPQQPVHHGQKKKKKRKRTDEATNSQLEAEDGEGAAGAAQRSKRRTKTRAEEEDAAEEEGGEARLEFAMLPDEVQVRVLSELSAMDLVTNVPLVCRRWRHLARDPTLWLHLHRRTFGGRPAKRRYKSDPPERASIVPWQETEEEELIDCMGNLMELARTDSRLAKCKEEAEKCKWKEVLKMSVDFGQAVSVRESLERIARLDAQASALTHQLLFKTRPPPRPLLLPVEDWSETLSGCLVSAFRRRYFEVAQILLEHGALINNLAMAVGFKSGVTASTLILDRVPHDDIIECLFGTFGLLEDIAGCGRVDVIQLLEAHDIITQEQRNETFASGLVQAVVGWNLKPVERLLEAGASANTLTTFKRKPLITKLMRWGFDCEAMEIAELLVARGACFDPRRPRRLILTPLERAVRYGRRRATNWLLAIGARPILRMAMVMRHGKRPTKYLRTCWAMVAKEAAHQPEYANNESWTYDFGNGEDDSDEDENNEAEDEYADSEEEAEFARRADRNENDEDDGKDDDL